VLKLFGAGYHSSLRYTMGDYLKSTEGTLRNELRPVRFRFLNYAFVVQPSCLTFLIDVPEDMGKRDSEENVSTQHHGAWRDLSRYTAPYLILYDSVLFCTLPALVHTGSASIC
jgi:hypothetical protein